ncbi:hypothetical protein Tco_0232954 [Tanacetum coccineum]
MLCTTISHLEERESGDLSRSEWILYTLPVDVPINEEVSALRFRMGMAEEENSSLHGRIKTMEATDKITRRQEKRARMELERQLTSVQET